VKEYVILTFILASIYMSWHLQQLSDILVLHWAVELLSWRTSIFQVDPETMNSCPAAKIVIQSLL